MKQALERAAIYFASGTGNSFLVAKWFQEACRARGIEADLAPANLAEVDEAILSSPGQLVALAFPTHGLLPPWSMIRFLFRLPRRPGSAIQR